MSVKHTAATETICGICAQFSSCASVPACGRGICAHSRHEGYRDGAVEDCTPTTVIKNGCYHINNNLKADYSKLCDNDRNTTNLTNFDAIITSVYDTRTKFRDEIINSDNSNEHKLIKSVDTLLESIPKLFSPNLCGLDRELLNVDCEAVSLESGCMHRGRRQAKGYSSSKFVWTSFLLLGLPSTVQPSYSGK
jgi:hypothetical protein